MGGRARAGAAPAPDRSWMKWKRCAICRKLICVNNYPDRRSRTPRIAGKVVCPWCSNHAGGKFVVQLMIIAERAAAQADGHCGGDDETCKCNGHVAKRILQKNYDLKPTQMRSSS